MVSSFILHNISYQYIKSNIKIINIIYNFVIENSPTLGPLL